MQCKAGRTYSPEHPTCISCERQSAMVCRGQLQKKASKHGNVRVEVDGIMFDSRREAKRYTYLKMLERVGAITDLRLQVPFVLQPAVVLDGRKKPAMVYRADFTYLENGVLVVSDSKSPHLRKNSTYRLKKHLMQSVHGIEILEV